jgi:hypothetical protein
MVMSLEIDFAYLASNIGIAIIQAYQATEKTVLA